MTKERINNDESRNLLVEKNLKLVGYTYGLFKSRYSSVYNADREDLTSAGNFGLIRAAELFDESRGTMFSTYAIRWIFRYMQVEAGINGYVSIKEPLPHTMQFSQIDSSARDLRFCDTVPGRPAVDPDGLESKEVVAEMLAILDRPPSRAKGKRGVSHWTWKGLRRVKDIVQKVAIEGYTLAEIGKKYGFCHQRALQLYRIGIERLRLSLQKKMMCKTGGLYEAFTPR